MTPLHLASKMGQLEICKFLCKYVREKNTKDDDGRTPLDLAITEQKWEISSFLHGPFSKPIRINDKSMLEIFHPLVIIGIFLRGFPGLPFLTPLHSIRMPAATHTTFPFLCYFPGKQSNHTTTCVLWTVNDAQGNTPWKDSQVGFTGV